VADYSLFRDLFVSSSSLLATSNMGAPQPSSPLVFPGMFPRSVEGLATVICIKPCVLCCLPASCSITELSWIRQHYSHEAAEADICFVPSYAAPFPVYRRTAKISNRLRRTVPVCCLPSVDSVRPTLPCQSIRTRRVHLKQRKEARVTWLWLSKTASEMEMLLA